METQLRSLLERNLDKVRKRIADACESAGRKPESVRLVAVTKYVDATIARELVRAGLSDLGESRPQELLSKAESLADLDVSWHLVGHLQRNKVRRVLPHVELLHSADSLRLIQTVNIVAAELNRLQPVLIEVNISGDASKHGVELDQVQSLLEAIAELTNVRAIGLMGLSGLESNATERRRQFVLLRELRDRLAPLAGNSQEFRELSMGMSDDFELAIAEGSTIVRIGSLLFDGITPSN